jgi:V/A-type H+-transporting ATPase subunit I
MLTASLYWGVGFIIIATSMTVINRWQEGEYASALFDSTGIAGILLYLGGFYAVERAFLEGVFGRHEQWAVGLPLTLILLYKWVENKLPFGERVLVTLIEGFDSILGYVANTLSFLRVAAFSLNHVALAIAVFTIAEMLDTMGEWTVIIVGNIFIILVEGAIVTIQILRLEYYESFSRFFNGNGRAFSPLRNGLKKSLEITSLK